MSLQEATLGNNAQVNPITEKHLLSAVAEYLKDCVPFTAYSITQTIPVLNFWVSSEDAFLSLLFLKNHINTQYSVLTAVIGTDYPYRARRFEVAYELLSIIFNSRVRLKLFAGESTPVKSVAAIFSGATWWEREIWDMFGVYFLSNREIKRLLTDYGFEGHPLRKDYPLMGFAESRYDDSEKRVVNESIEHSQECRLYNHISG